MIPFRQSPYEFWYVNINVHAPIKIAQKNIILVCMRHQDKWLGDNFTGIMEYGNGGMMGKDE